MSVGCFLAACNSYYPATKQSFNLNKTDGKYRVSLIMDPQSFEVGRLIGSYGFLNVIGYSGFQSQLEDVGRLKFQDVNQGSVQISEWMRHKLPPQDFQERVRRCATPSTVLAAYAPNVAPFMFDEMSGDSDFEALVASPEKKKKGGRKLAVANPSAITVKKSDSVEASNHRSITREDVRKMRPLTEVIAQVWIQLTQWEPHSILQQLFRGRVATVLQRNSELDEAEFSNSKNLKNELHETGRGKESPTETSHGPFDDSEFGLFGFQYGLWIHKGFQKQFSRADVKSLT
ncbi:hypothetical protein Tco_0959472, partial [Tanacetum coccineum]